MPSAAREVLWPQIQRAQLVQILCPQAREFIQQIAQRLAFALAFLRETIEALEWLRLAGFQDPPRTREPVGEFAMDEVADDVVGAPSLLAFIAVRPCLR